MPEESTTPDLVDLVRSMFESTDRYFDFDAIAGLAVPEVVWDLSDMGLGIYEGIAACREFIKGSWAIWEDHHHKIEEILDLGTGVVFVALWEDGRPIGSDSRVQARQGDVFEFAGGQGHSDYVLHRPRRGPCCRRTRRAGTGVGDVAGEFMTPAASPVTDEVGETWPVNGGG
jgi:ketosteroid isomerase-like protein